MEQYKDLVNDPAKLEAKLKEDWAKIDAKGEGSVSLEVFHGFVEKMIKHFNVDPSKLPKKEDNDKIVKLVDPEGTGKVNFEGYQRLVHAGLEQLKKLGKV